VRRETINTLSQLQCKKLGLPADFYFDLLLMAYRPRDLRNPENKGQSPNGLDQSDPNEPCSRRGLSLLDATMIVIGR